MMYLSKLYVNPKNKKVRKDLSDCHDMHRTIMSAFPDIQCNNKSTGARAHYGVLYRIEVDTANKAVVIYVQSKVKPDWTTFYEDYLLDTVIDNPACKKISDNYENLKEGMTLRFKMCANPTRKVSKPGPDGKMPRQGKRVELYKEEDQLGWLHNKAKNGGFKLKTVNVNNNVEDIRIIPSGKISQLKGSRKTQDGDTKPKHKLTFASVIYEGHLCIVELSKFKEALEEGIGSGKAYGFGLLSVAPYRL